MMPPAPTVHICDDWISIDLPDWKMILAARNALSSNNCWTEIVPGLDSMAVQFDPARISPDDAAELVMDQMRGLTVAATDSRSTMTIPVCYDAELAPDCQFVAEKLQIPVETLPSWHEARLQRVTMLGFMPGFAYLQSEEPCVTIGRLSSPRQLVKAGSIGIIGQQSCIYSFDSPGGWPIIGRTPLRLFDPAGDQPALLSAGQIIRFEAISREAFENWPQATGK